MSVFGRVACRVGSDTIEDMKKKRHDRWFKEIAEKVDIELKP